MTQGTFVTAPGVPGLSWRARLGFALAAAVCSLLVNQFVYFNTPVTTDENSYVFQARTFLEGRLARPCPPVPPVFDHEMIIMDPNVGWLSRYPPAHPLWLIPGVWLDQPRIMIALAAALSVWFLSGSALWLGGSALAVCLALLFSPYFQFMHGTLLSHTSGLLAVSLLWWAYVRWQTGGRTLFAAMAGLAWAFLFLNRTYTGLLVALPLGLDATVRLALKWRRGSHWAGTALFGLTALTGVGGYLLYNYLVLGDPFKSTYLQYADEWTLGFSANHGVRDGLRFAAQNLQLLDRWLWGSPGSLLIVGAAAVIGWSTVWTPVCVGCILAVVLGFVAFSYPGFNASGPYYYFETLPFVVTLVGLAAARIRRWRRGPWLLAVLTLALVVASLAFMKQEVRRTRKARAQDTRAWATLRRAPPRALVFVTGFREPVGRHLLLNARGVLSDPLVVSSWGEKNMLAACAFPDRTCYWLRPDRDRVEPFTVTPRTVVYDIPATDLTPLTEVRESAPEGVGEVLAAEALRDKPGYLAQGKQVPLIAGRYRLVCRIGYEGVTPVAPLRLEVAAESDGRRLACTSLTGSATNADVTLLFTVPAYDRVEPRLHYGGSGRGVLQGLRLEQATPSPNSGNAP